MYSVAQTKDAVKWSTYKTASKQMAERFVRIGGIMFSRGMRMSQCSEFITSAVCPNCGTHGHTITNLCRDRLCPICAWRLSRARFAQMAKIIELTKPYLIERNTYCQFITLTVRNVPLFKLSEQLKTMSKAWDKLSHRKPLAYRDILIGWARNTEITINEKTREAHPHLHIMLLWDGRAKKQAIEWGKKLSQEWKTALGVDYNPIVDARDAYSKKKGFDIIEDNSIVDAVLEATKYCVKTDDIAELSDQELVMFACQIKGYRFSSYGGLIKTMRANLGLDDEDYNEIDNGNCTKCGTKMVHYLMQWTGAKYAITEMESVTNE